MSPRKYRRAKLAHRALTWDDVGPNEMLDFFAGWHPPRTDVERPRSPWQTWREYLTAWLMVRDDGLAGWHAHRAERLAARRAMVAQRAAELAEVAHDFSPAGEGRRERLARLHAEAEERLVELEREGAPFAEQLLVAVQAGEDPETWAAERWRARLELLRRRAAGLGTT